MEKQEVLNRLKTLKMLAEKDFKQQEEDDDIEDGIDYVEGYLDAINMVINHFNGA